VFPKPVPAPVWGLLFAAFHICPEQHSSFESSVCIFNAKQHGKPQKNNCLQFLNGLVELE
jgi:hypothetical protein